MGKKKEEGFGNHAEEDVHGTGLIKAVADQLLAQCLEVLPRGRVESESVLSGGQVGGNFVNL